MIRNRHIASLCLATLLVASPAASAQNGKQPKPPDAKAPDGKVPNGKAPDAKPKEPPITDPLVKEVLESYNPENSTPDDLVQAVKLILDLRHPRAARPYVAKLAGLMLDDGQWARLGRKFGTAEFLRMALQTELQPQGKAVSDKVLAATTRYARDPKRLAGLIDRLRNPSARERAAATTELAYGGDASVNAMLSVLADAARAAEHANIRAALVDLGSHSTEPLIGALETDNPALKVQIIDVLRRLDARDASIYLLRPAIDVATAQVVQAAAAEVLKEWVGRTVTREQAIATLSRHARFYYGGGEPKLPDSAGNLTIWQWDAQRNQVAQRTLKAQDVSLALAARVAADWLALDPNNQEARRIFLTSLLHVAAYQNGLAKPLPSGAGTARDRASALGVPAIEDAMIHAMEEGRAATAGAAARLLGETGREDLLQGVGGKPSPLVRAVSHADARVRFAAVEAILKLQPKKPFAWSHTVPQTLAFFAGTTGSLQAVVADVNAEEAQRLAGLLTELGYEGQTASSARQMVRRAMASPDVALVVFNTSLPYADADLLIQELRHDAHGADARRVSEFGQGRRPPETADAEVPAHGGVGPHAQRAGHAVTAQSPAFDGGARFPHARRTAANGETIAHLAGPARGPGGFVLRPEDARAAAGAGDVRARPECQRSRSAGRPGHAVRAGARWSTWPARRRCRSRLASRRPPVLPAACRGTGSSSHARSSSGNMTATMPARLAIRPPKTCWARSWTRSKQPGSNNPRNRRANQASGGRQPLDGSDFTTSPSYPGAYAPRSPRGNGDCLRRVRT